MPTDIAIKIEDVSKCYHLYDNPRDRMLQMLFGKRKQYYREFWAVKGISLDIMRGEVIGIVGNNGAGKSTLLQMVSGILQPTEGKITVNGRVAAILELGAGFNPELSGRENIYLSTAIMGLTRSEIDNKYDEIVSFSGIGDFINQPVKIYSSGMYVRLAFSVATAIDPDILIIDEALSVGDGDFSRKSYDRIVALKERGTTILFCSHSIYQVEAFCDRVIWVNYGKCASLGDPQSVITRYNAFILEGKIRADDEDLEASSGLILDEVAQRTEGYFSNIEITMDGVIGSKFTGQSGKSNLTVKLEFYLNPSLPTPTVGINIDYETAVAVTTIISHIDKIAIERNTEGYGCVEIDLSELPLRKGDYFISAYLGCENAVYFYDQAIRIASFRMVDQYPAPGLFSLPRKWLTSSPEKGDKKNLLVMLPWGHKIETDSADSLGLRQNNGHYEAEVTTLCCLLIKAGDQVLDIGANIGYYSLLFSSLVTSSGAIIAFEPNLDNYDLLQQNIANNGLHNVSMFRLALGSKPGRGQLFQATEGNGQHRLYPSVCCSGESTEVEVVAADDLHLDPLDFVKIDIEGYEPMALEGLTETIAKSPNLKILCEFSPLSMWEAGSSPLDFINKMKSLRFHLVVFETDRWIEMSFDVLLLELKKIPETAIRALIDSFEPGQSAQDILQQVNMFLSRYNYGREHLENILLVAPGAWPRVKVDLQSSVVPWDLS